MSLTKKLLDGKEMFILWAEMGTTTKVAQHLAKKGIRNPRTGRPYTVMTVWNNAIKWVVHNPEEARPYFIKEGAMFSDDDWHSYLIQKSSHVFYTKMKFIAWAKKLGIFRKYFWQFADRYGLTEEDLEYYDGQSTSVPRS